jgi:hypothetical protein
MVLQAEKFNTSSHKNMNHLDFELKHLLKDWAEQQPLPATGKSQLLKSAVGLKEKATRQPTGISRTQPTDLISWAMVYCLDRRISTARIVT